MKGFVSISLATDCEVQRPGEWLYHVDDDDGDDGDGGDNNNNNNNNIYSTAVGLEPGGRGL